MLPLSILRRNLQSYIESDILVSRKKHLFISSNFHNKDEFHSCVLKFGRDHVIRLGSISPTIPCRISEGLPTFTTWAVDITPVTVRKPYYLNESIKIILRTIKILRNIMV